MYTVEIKCDDVWVRTRHTSDNVRDLGAWLYRYATNGYEVRLSYVKMTVDKEFEQKLEALVACAM